MSLEALVDDLKSLIVKAGKEIVAYQSKNNTLTIKIDESNSALEKTNARNIDLDKREAEVSSIESAVKIQQETKTLIKGLGQDKVNFADDKRIFSEYALKEKTFIDDRQRCLSAGEDCLKDGQKKLAADQEALEERKKNIKQEVLVEIAKKIG